MVPLDCEIELHIGENQMLSTGVESVTTTGAFYPSVKTQGPGLYKFCSKYNDTKNVLQQAKYLDYGSVVLIKSTEQECGDSNILAVSSFTHTLRYQGYVYTTGYNNTSWEYSAWTPMPYYHDDDDHNHIKDKQQTTTIHYSDSFQLLNVGSKGFAYVTSDGFLSHTPDRSLASIFHCERGAKEKDLLINELQDMLNHINRRYLDYQSLHETLSKELEQINNDMQATQAEKDAIADKANNIMKQKQLLEEEKNVLFDKLKNKTCELKKNKQDGKLLQEQVQNLKEEKCCVICLVEDKMRDVLYMPCNHLCVCSDCDVDDIKTCPLCSTEITKKIKVYAFN